MIDDTNLYGRATGLDQRGRHRTVRSAFDAALKDLLTDEEKKHFDEKVGLVEASIGRMVPVQTEEMKDGDPMRVCVERYGFLPVDLAAFKGEVPEIQNLVPFEPFDFYIKRKLYVYVRNAPTLFMMRPKLRRIQAKLAALPNAPKKIDLCLEIHAGGRTVSCGRGGRLLRGP